jgi:hypothetical protein
VAPVATSTRTVPPAIAATVNQNQTDMENAIRSVLAADPRAAALPPDQLNSMVQALTKSAVSQGLQPTDIHSPVSTNTIGGASGNTSAQCAAGTPSFLCALIVAFGFDGSNLIPLWLGGSAAILILLIGTILEIRHLEHKKEQEAQEAAVQVHNV